MAKRSVWGRSPGLESNLPEILEDMRILDQCGDLERAGVGDKLLDAAVDGFASTAAGQLSPDGTPFADLSEAYAREKARTHPGEPIGRREGTMLGPEEIRGDRAVSSPEALYTYGATDQGKAEMAWFADPDRPGQPARPVIGFTDRAVADCERIGADHLDDIMGKL